MKEKITTLYNVQKDTNNFFVGIDKKRRKVVNSKIVRLNSKKYLSLLVADLGTLCGASVTGMGFISNMPYGEHFYYILGPAIVVFASSFAPFCELNSKRKAEIEKKLEELKQQRAEINNLIASNKKPNKSLKKYKVKKF